MSSKTKMNSYPAWWATLVRYQSRDVALSVRLAVVVSIAYVVSLTPVDGFGFDVIQAVLAFVLLSFVPGFLVVEWIRDELRDVDVLYAIGLSLAISMFVGWAANALYRGLSPDFLPFTQPNTAIVYLSSIGVLTGVSWYFNDDPPTYSVVDLLTPYDLRVLAALAALPLVAVGGALLINQTRTNTVTLLAIVLVGVVSVAMLYFDSEGRYDPFSVLSIALSLLLTNTVIMTYLTNGDGRAEYGFARGVLELGYWVPGAAKNAMPRIGILHPAYSLLMDLNLLWEFKLVHPILFATVPVVAYVIASRYFSRDVAYLGALLYIFLPRTYQLLGRNTRTGGAILFTAFLLLVLLDDDLSPSSHAVLAIGFFWGVITSHYGIGPLVLFALVVAYVLNAADSVVSSVKESFRSLHMEFVLFCGVLLVAWYLYLTSGAFNFVIISLYNQVSGQVFFTSQSTAVRSAAFEMPSFSYEVLFYGHIAVAILTSLGFGLVFLRYLARTKPVPGRVAGWVRRNVLPGLGDRAVSDSNYVYLVVAFFLFFPLSFGPNILSAGRTYGLVMVLLAPFPILVLRSQRLKLIGRKPIVLALVALLVITSGFVSATVTHDVSPQPIIDQEQIIEEGNVQEQLSLYRKYTSRSMITASHFMLTYASDGSAMYGTTSGQFIGTFYDRPTSVSFDFNSLEEYGGGSGYIYLSEPDLVSDTLTTGYLGFDFYEYETLPSYRSESVVYTNGDNKVLT